MYKDLIIASNNKNKVKEIKELFSDMFENIYSLKDKGIDIEIAETGSTFEENAIIKAKEVCKITNMVALADDSGLEVLALGGAPGVYSARYAGEPTDDNANNKKLLHNMIDIIERSARFTSCVAIAYPSGEIYTAHGHVEGKILYEEVGENGFGYDPLFLSTELGKTFGQATSEEKNSISHRARALENLKKILKK